MENNQIDQNKDEQHKNGGALLPPSYVITGDKLFDEAPEKLPTLWDPILPKVGLAGLVGPSDCGKSSFLRDLCISIVTGKTEFLNFPLNALHKSIIYVSTEDDKNAYGWMMKKQLQDQTFNKTDLVNLRLICETDKLLLRLEKELQRQLADVIIIDTFSDIYQGNINISNEVRAFLHKFKVLAQKYSCLIIFLHHTGKRTENMEPSKNNILGSQGFESKSRVIMELRAEKNTNIRHLWIVKGNYLGKDVKSKGLSLQFTDNLTFKNTGEAIPLSSMKMGARNEEFYRDAIEHFHSEGKSLRWIATYLENKYGYRISHASVGNVVKEIEAGTQYLYKINAFTPDLNS